MVNDQHPLADRLPGRTRGQTARCLSRSPISDSPALTVAGFTSIRQLACPGREQIGPPRAAQLDVEVAYREFRRGADPGDGLDEFPAGSIQQPVPYHLGVSLGDPKLLLKALVSRAYRSPRSTRAWRALASASVWRSGSQYAAECARRDASADTRESDDRDVSCVA